MTYGLIYWDGRLIKINKIQLRRFFSVHINYILSLMTGVSRWPHWTAYI